MEIIHRPSPNFDERDAEASLLILHYTGMKTGAEAIARLCDAEAKVSSHYVIEENGDVYQLVDESKRAWHAGVSFWRGLRNLNAHSIGIEIVNPGHEFGYREFTEAQYKSIIELCAGIKSRHGIHNINIIGHSDIAPDRKDDPGELFDWKLLAKYDLGLWAEYKKPLLKFLAKKPVNPVTGEALTLIDLGYEFHNEKSIIAFQRHWRTDDISGIWDEACANILAQLLKQSED